MGSYLRQMERGNTLNHWNLSLLDYHCVQRVTLGFTYTHN